MLEFIDRVLGVIARIGHGLAIALAWIRWAGEVVVHVVRHYWPVVAPFFRSFGRPVVLLLAGLIIPFIANHGNIVGLQWLTAISIVSLLVRDDRESAITRGVWWINVLFTGATALGLMLGTIGPTSALSLTIPLVLFECARAFIRSEPIAGWGSAILALVLTIVVFPSRDDSTIATGSIGAWAIILGVFAAISQSETLMATGKKAIRRVTKR